MWKWCTRSRVTPPGTGRIPRTWSGRPTCGPTPASAHTGAGNTRAWLAAICLNVARSQARRRGRRAWEMPAGALLEAPPAARVGGGEAAADVADVAIAGLAAEKVSRCLARLPEPQRECIVLMDVAGYTAREAAEAL